jgi:hypothetical protein
MSGTKPNPATYPTDITENSKYLIQQDYYGINGGVQS